MPHHSRDVSLKLPEFRSKWPWAIYSGRLAHLVPKSLSMQALFPLLPHRKLHLSLVWHHLSPSTCPEPSSWQLSANYGSMCPGARVPTAENSRSLSLSSEGKRLPPSSWGVGSPLFSCSLSELLLIFETGSHYVAPELTL